jgi:hypothetical protein
MNIKDGILLILASLVFGWLLLKAHPTIKDPMALGEIAVIDTIKPVIQQDTIKASVQQDTIHSVKGKNALFIGDSHTAADYGWQHQLCKKTQMKYLNTAVGGKQTGWMLEVAKLNINSGYDYCFIYGGANDMAGNRPPIKSVKNIQKIVNMCLAKQVKPIVITGFDPLTCVNVTGRDIYKEYPKRYARFQQMLIDSIVGATVLKTHCISRTDCGDYLCHMTGSGHRKMSEFIISACRFKVY